MDDFLKFLGNIDRLKNWLIFFFVVFVGRVIYKDVI